MYADSEWSLGYFQQQHPPDRGRDDVYALQKERWEAQQKRHKQNTDLSLWGAQPAPAWSAQQEGAEEDEDSDTYEVDDFEPVSVMARDDLFRLVRASKMPEDAVQLRVETLDEFHGVQTDFAHLRKDILSRFDPKTGYMRWHGVVWEADGVSAFFEGYNYWDADRARNDFYTMLVNEPLWRAAVVSVAGVMCLCEDKRPGILTHPNTGPYIWRLLPPNDALSLRRVCKYTKRMHDMWIPLYYPERGKKNAAAIKRANIKAK